MWFAKQTKVGLRSDPRRRPGDPVATTIYRNLHSLARKQAVIRERDRQFMWEQSCRVDRPQPFEKSLLFALRKLIVKHGCGFWVFEFTTVPRIQLVVVRSASRLIVPL